jgi:hypothetical protein
MAESRPAVAEESAACNIAPEPSSSTATEPVQSDTSSLQSNDQYEPLPAGCWTVAFHGNCPKCHHHNKALQVQIKVTPNASQVSYIQCERCRDRWAALGGRNSTRISLLSTTTTEPDYVERGVRYKFVEIVKLAQQAAILESLPESSSPVASRQPPVGAQIDHDSSAAPQSLDLTVLGSDAKDATPAEPRRYQRSPVPTSTLSTEGTLTPKRRSGTLRLLSKFKIKITTRFPMLNRVYGRRIADTYKPGLSVRQFEKSPVRTPPAVELNSTPSKQPHPIDQDRIGTSDSFEAEVVEPSKRIAEVIAFIAKLDKSALNSMSEPERADWMRREYTNFKSQRRRLAAPLSMSPIVQTSIQGRPPRHVSSQLPPDFFGIGGQMEGFESFVSALRRGSFTISEDSETQSMSDATTAASSRRSSGQLYFQHWRQRLGRRRPQSSPYPQLSDSHLRPNMRNSAETLVPRDRDSNSSMRGQRGPSRLSQSTTMWTSAPTVRPASSGTTRPESRDDPNIESQESQESTPSPHSTPQPPQDPPRQA